jgi:flagellar biosynthesis protein FlhF
MKILTFSGSTPAEALKKAQLAVGEDAMLIGTYEIQKKTEGEKALYEIAVGVKGDDLSQLQAKRGKSLSRVAGDLAKKFSTMAKMIEKEEPSLLPSLEKPTATLCAPSSRLPKEEWNLPNEFERIYHRAKQSGMNPDHLDTIMALTAEYMPLGMRENPETLDHYFQSLVAKLITVRPEKSFQKGDQRVVMLVGSTGVGKTTSVAKLAARYGYFLEKPHKVGLIVLDTYRMGAAEPLLQYSRMMRVDLEMAVDADELAHALASLRECDYILIDTMGVSPNDHTKVGKIEESLQKNRAEYAIEVILVLPSTVKYDDLHWTYDHFSPLGIDSVLFTKLDETRGLGNIFSLLYATHLPVSYVTTGQEVPEDLRVARSDFLTQWILDGFHKNGQ